MKKVLSLILTVVLLLALLPSNLFGISVFAVSKYEDLYYTISDGEVYITQCTAYNKEEIIIPETIAGCPVTKIKENALNKLNGLKKVVIPNTVNTIELNAFYSCYNLESVNIPASVTYIGETAFDNCRSLKSITVDENNQVYSSDENGILFNKDKTELLSCPLGSTLSSYTVPNSVKSIYNSSFRNCKLESVIIPDSVESIGTFAFSGNDSLKTVTIANSVKSIGIYAFSGCDNLTAVNIPTSLTEIETAVFSGCYKLKSITIPNNIQNIGERAFSNCSSLESIEIPDGIVCISTQAFKGCSDLTNVHLPISVTTIEDSAFNYCENLKEVWYSGTKEQKSLIQIASNNDSLTDAKWYFNVCKGEHTYSTDCDESCNLCGATRKTTHNYASATCTKAKTCKVCGATSGSKLGHIYETTTVKATTTKNGKIEKKCSKCGYIASTSTTINKINSVKLSASTYTYNGKVKNATITVKDSAGKTISSKYYTVTYASGRKNVGTYKVTVKFRGNYSGTKTLTFTITPVKTTVSRLTAGKKSLTVSIAKKSTQVTGYQIQYSTSKKFTSAKVKTISSYKSTKTTIKRLSAKKTYYVRVRTYKTVSGKKYYSAWSTYKYTKTK